MGGRKSEITDREQDVEDIGLDWLDMGDVTPFNGSHMMVSSSMSCLEGDLSDGNH